jgi:splicing factor U2AF subunit
LSPDVVVQYGQVLNLVIPRPTPGGGPPPSGLGKVVVEYNDADSASKARMAMHNRRFAGRTVTAIYLDENAYAAGNLD